MNVCLQMCIGEREQEKLGINWGNRRNWARNRGIGGEPRIIVGWTNITEVENWMTKAFALDLPEVIAHLLPIYSALHEQRLQATAARIMAETVENGVSLKKKKSRGGEREKSEDVCLKKEGARTLFQRSHHCEAT